MDKKYNGVICVVKNRPLIIAHRGASADAPENTLAAFQLAIEQGSDGVELDVQLTKDGQIVVIHDDSIDRTTTGTGKVWELTADQIRQYDAGSWFHEKYSGERVPLLSEVFNLMPRSMLINVEIKNLPHTYKGIEEKVAELIVHHNRLDTVVVSSFDYQSLQNIKKINNNIKIGLLYYHMIPDHLEMVNLFGLPVYSLHPDHRKLNKGDIEGIRKAGYEVFPWTVNSSKELKKLINENPSGIITNYPLKMRRLLTGR